MGKNSICAKCGGRCCKSFACIFAPEDLSKFGVTLTLDDLTEFMSTGMFALDSYFDSENDTFIWFIRPRHKECPIVDESYGGECIFLFPNGCMLDWDKRPLQGKSIDSNLCVTGTPGNGLSKKYMAKRWLPYQEILATLAEKFKEE